MAAIATATESELLLYRVLQRANLTQYFETFIQQGGDDIGQLCEAGEEEFLEIMALVGMASKPLHVRRLQKSLQEWVTNPGLFAKPIGPATPHPPIASGSIIASVSHPQRSPSIDLNACINHISPPCAVQTNHQVIPSSVEEVSTPQSWIPKSLESVWTPKPDSRSCSPNPITYTSPKASNCLQSVSMSTQQPHDNGISQSPLALPVFLSEPAPMWKAPVLSSGLNGGQSLSSSLLDQTSRSSVSPTPSTGSETNHGNPAGVTNGTATMGLSSNQIPSLSEQQLVAIECAAEALANELPVYEVRKLNMKKDINRDILEVINMSDDNPEKMVHLRKYSAIYGRFDSKRKNEGKMSMHEVSVNEASTQLCKRIPALLTRRDDLYPLSRRIVRDSGYQYSKGHSRATSSMDIPPNKKLKMECTKKSMSPSAFAAISTSIVPAQYENRVSEINKEINDIIAQQEVLKSEISKARENHKKEQLEILRSDLEKCQDRQLQLRMEQSGIVGSSRAKAQKCKPSEQSPVHVNIATSSKESASSPHKTHTGLSNHTSDSAIDLSHPISVPTTKNSGSATTNASHSNKTSSRTMPQSPEDCCVLDLSASDMSAVAVGASVKKEGVNESLLEEGLRIAEQYGMCDLAEEIKYMKDEEESSVKGDEFKDSALDSGNNSDEIDEQEEWNKEVERDMVRLKTTPTSPAAGVRRGMRTRSRSSAAEVRS